MNDFLAAVYEHLRRQGVYDHDAIDGVCWFLFFSFLIILILF